MKTSKIFYNTENTIDNFETIYTIPNSLQLVNLYLNSDEKYTISGINQYISISSGEGILEIDGIIYNLFNNTNVIIPYDKKFSITTTNYIKGLIVYSKPIFPSDYSHKNAEFNSGLTKRTGRFRYIYSPDEIPRNPVDFLRTFTEDIKTGYSNICDGNNDKVLEGSISEIAKRQSTINKDIKLIDLKDFEDYSGDAILFISNEDATKIKTQEPTYINEMIELIKSHKISIIPFTTNIENKDSHKKLFIINSHKKIIYHFDPNGSTWETEIEDRLKLHAKNFFKNLKYHYVDLYNEIPCIKFPQQITMQPFLKLCREGGLCNVFITMFVHLQILYPSKNIIEITQEISKVEPNELLQLTQKYFVKLIKITKTV